MTFGKIMSAPYQFLAHAKKSFAFLAALGFRVESEHEGTYASFKDGFEVAYSSKNLDVRVAYYDMELDIIFKKDRIVAPYLFLDHNLYANASGLAGCMFPIEKLGPVIDRVAKDIEAHYEDVIRGDAAMWQKIEKLVLAPRARKRFLP
jgi:hypothetical protein